MKMFSQKVGLALATGALVAGSTIAVSAPASAATLDVNFEGNDITFTVVQADQEFNCPQFDHAGTFDDVTNTGELVDLTASGCMNHFWGGLTITPNGDWDFAIDANLRDTAWHADLTNVTFFVSHPGCSFSAAGSAGGTFDTSTQTFNVTESNLVIADNPAGFICPIFGVSNGDDIEIDGTWTNIGTPIILP